MNHVRAQQLLQGQSNLAKKVYEIVPIQEAWTCNYIVSEMNKVHGTNGNVAAIRACLGDLEDQGLITQSTGKFQRVAVKAPKVNAMSGVAALVKSAVPAEKESNMSLLADLAAEMDALTEYTTTRMRDISKRIEDVAIAVELEKKASSGASEKLKQLQTLLKGLGD